MMRSAATSSQPVATKRPNAARKGMQAARVASRFQQKKPSTGFSKKTTFIVQSYYGCNR
jgi:hypothetical protein